MLQYFVAGIVTGCIYAIASTGLVMTYRSTGILNFGFGGIAFAIARLYYYLNTEHGWSIWAAAVTSILVVAPLLGVILHVVLFRLLKTSSTLVKMIGTIGLGVTLPPLSILILGNPLISTTPGLAPLPVASYRVFGVSINLDQIIIVACLVGILAIGYVILRFTEWGTVIRAVVDSPALTSLTGTNPNIMAVAVSALTTGLAGLAGVLLAPTVGLVSTQFDLLVAAAFTAVLVAKLTRISRSILASLILGVAASLLQYYLPPTSPASSGLINSVPFALIFLFLVWEARNGTVIEGVTTTGDLDQAVAVKAHHGSSGDGPSMTAQQLHFPISRRPVLNARSARALTALALAAVLPLLLSDFWVAQVGLGLCFGVIFLSSTVVTGEGGMIWLCQAGFAGIGAVLAAHLVSIDHVPVLAAVLIAGILVAPIGFLAGILTTWLGDLYVALVTLALGVLIDNLVLSLHVFTTDLDTGVAIARPSFAADGRSFAYFALAVFVIISLIIEHFRRSTAGLLLAAVRRSDRAAASMGINVMISKVSTGTLAAFVAGIGGALVAVDLQLATPSSFNTSVGLIWLAVLVTMGVRSCVGAGAAGLLYAIFPALVITYLPTWVSPVPAALFGLGAILLARNPDGIAAMHRQQVVGLVNFLRHRSRPSAAPGGEVAGDSPVERDVRAAAASATTFVGGRLARSDDQVGEVAGVVGPGRRDRDV